MGKAKYSISNIKSCFHIREPWLNVFIISFFTIPLTYVVANYTKLTPNKISILSILFGLLAAWFYLNGDVVFGAASYFISYLFDAIDGKIARIKNIKNPYGSWVDVFIDRTNLTLISTSIAYNSYQISGDSTVLVLNSLFLGLAFIGWESRYNINIYKLNKGQQLLHKEEAKSRYAKWTLKMGVDISPVSLVEVFLFYLIIAPLFHIELEALLIVMFFLVARIVMQQKFWYEAVNNKT